MTTGSYPYITKDSSLSSIGTVTKSQYFSDFAYGEQISGTYPLTAKITSDFYLLGQTRPRIRALRNTLDYYRHLSDYYSYMSGAGGDYSNQTLRCINIPSIFYGQSIKKGTLNCKWFVTGTLIAELKDENRNGELIQIGPYGSLGSGGVAGVVLYNEGFILLNGNWNLSNTYTDEFNIFDPGVLTYAPKWLYFYTTGSNNVGLVPSSSFSIDFDGTEQIPTITMLTHAKIGEFNHSNNPTFIDHNQILTPLSSSTTYREKSEITIKNTVPATYNEVKPIFEKTVFISKIGIYDEEKNLIAVAKLATPVRKRESDSISIKIKLDL